MVTASRHDAEVVSVGIPLDEHEATFPEQPLISTPRNVIAEDQNRKFGWKPRERFRVVFDRTDRVFIRMVEIISPSDMQRYCRPLDGQHGVGGACRDLTPKLELTPHVI